MEWWSYLGIVCGTLLAVAAVIRSAVKGLRHMWSLVRKATQFFDQVIGDDTHKSLMELLEEQMSRMERIERAQAEHLELWHGHSNGPAAAAGPRPVQPRGRRG